MLVSRTIRTLAFAPRTAVGSCRFDFGEDRLLDHWLCSYSLQCRCHGEEPIERRAPMRLANVTGVRQGSTSARTALAKARVPGNVPS